MPTSLAAIILTLRPQNEASPSSWSGYVAQRWFVEALAAAAPALEQRITAGDGMRPYTVSALLGAGLPRRHPAPLSPDKTYALRLTTLDGPLTDFVLGEWLPTLPGREITLGEVTLTIEDATSETETHLWAGTTTYGDLIYDQTLREVQTPRNLKMRFDSPTFFSSGGRQLPLLMPELLFGNLIDRWQLFSDVKLHSDARRFAEACIEIGYYRLRTRHAVFTIHEHTIHATGFTGTARFRITHADPYWRRVIHTLAAYSFYAGVGARTTMGFGQARMLAD